MKQYITFLETTIKQTGKIVLDKFGQDGVKETKSSPVDFLTQTDLEANTFISENVKASFPTHGIISEEDKASKQNAEFVWIIDPIDGTNNFATHIPLFGIMIALKQKDEIILSGIYLPITNEYFFAQKDHGAYLNGKPIHCSTKPDWPGTFGCTNATRVPKNFPLWEKFNNNFGSETFVLNSFGCAAVTASAVACGRRDWMVSHGGQFWDHAPTFLLLKESGCKVTDINGGPWDLPDTSKIAANPELHKKLANLLK